MRVPQNKVFAVWDLKRRMVDFQYPTFLDLMEITIIGRMIEEFEMFDLGRMHYFLGLKVMHLDSGIIISKKRYAKEVLKKFRMNKSNLVINPNVRGVKIDKNDTSVTIDNSIFKKLVVSLIYLTPTRPDLMYEVSVVSRYMAKPT